MKIDSFIPGPIESGSSKNTIDVGMFIKVIVSKSVYSYRAQDVGINNIPSAQFRFL